MILSALFGMSAAGAAVAIFILSVIPPLRIEHVGTANSGLWAHIAAYGMLCLLTCMWLHTGCKARRPAVYAALGCAAYGFTIECVQYVVPYRRFEVGDVLINCCAVIAVAMFCHWSMPCFLRSAVQRNDTSGTNSRQH